MENLLNLKKKFNIQIQKSPTVETGGLSNGSD